MPVKNKSIYRIGSNCNNICWKPWLPGFFCTIEVLYLPFVENLHNSSTVSQTGQNVTAWSVIAKVVRVWEKPYLFLSTHLLSVPVRNALLMYKNTLLDSLFHSTAIPTRFCTQQGLLVSLGDWTVICWLWADTLKKNKDFPKNWAGYT